MPYLITDTTCQHTVAAALIREHAEEQARLAQAAGYPSTVDEWETVDLDAAPPADCQRCWRRLEATLDLMQRERAQIAALAAGVDPFDVTAAYTAIRRRHPEFPPAEVADAAITELIPQWVRRGARFECAAPDAIPDWVIRKVGTP